MQKNIKNILKNIFQKKSILPFLIIFIIAVGFFVRIYNIDETPPGIYPDEAVNGIDALTALDTGHFQWFYTANNGREGLFMNLIAFCFKIFGISALTLRLPAIIFGTLTIFGTYLLSKELFKKNRIALISAFLVAVSYWGINFSRISFRANMVPFILVFSFYFIFKGLRTKKISDFIFGGIFFGIGFHTYIAFRIAPLIFIILLISLIINRKDFWKDYKKHILAFFISAVALALPIILTYLSHPEYLESRSASVSVFSPEMNDGHPLKELGRSLFLSLIKYNFWGDQNWRHNYPPYPILDIASGVGFLFGIIYALIKFFHFATLRFKKNIRDNHFDVYVLLFSWFFLMLAPEFMTAEGLPHALRSIGTLPVVFIFSALAFNYFLEISYSHTHILKTFNYSLVIFVLVSIGFFNGIKYHIVFPKKPEAARSFEKNLIDASNYLKSLPKEKEKFVFAESMQRIPIQVLNWKLPNTQYLYRSQMEELSPKTDDFVVILAEKNDELKKYLTTKFPNHKFRELTSPSGLSFCTLTK